MTTGSSTHTFYGEAADAYAQGLADGTAAERERLRQLAVQCEATYRPEDPDLPRLTGVPDLTKPGPDPLGDPFADLIGPVESEWCPEHRGEDWRPE